MKAILFGDSHFGSGDGYGRYPGERLKDQQAALEAVVDLAIEHQVDLVGFCGDAFEGPQVTPEQYEAFRAPLRRLDIPVVGISGNGRHDAATRSVNALEVCSDVMDVHRVPALVEIAGVHIGLMPWTAGVSRLAAARDGGDRDELHDDAGALLVQVARDLYAQIPDGAPSLLLGHWSLSGAHLSERAAGRRARRAGDRNR